MMYDSEAVFAGPDRITSLKADVDALLRQLSEGGIPERGHVCQQLGSSDGPLHPNSGADERPGPDGPAGPHGSSTDRRPDGGGPDDYGDE